MLMEKIHSLHNFDDLVLLMRNPWCWNKSLIDISMSTALVLWRTCLMELKTLAWSTYDFRPSHEHFGLIVLKMVSSIFLLLKKDFWWKNWVLVKCLQDVWWNDCLKEYCFWVICVNLMAYSLVYTRDNFLWDQQ